MTAVGHLYMQTNESQNRGDTWLEQRYQGD